MPLESEHDLCGDASIRQRFSSCSPNFAVTADLLPHDELFPAQWGHSEAGIGAVGAWDTISSSPDVVVAVLDTGIDPAHPDLAPNLWRNPGEIPSNGIDDDGNGFIDDIHGVNTSADTGDPLDDSGHGTHVAGIVGAVGNNRIGIAGMSWDVQIMALKFLGADGVGRLSDALEAFDYAIAMRNRGVNVRIVNTSWGGSPFSQPFADALAALGKAGIAVVVSSGNLGTDNDAEPHYPASFLMPHLASIAALDRDGKVAAFSNYRSEGPQLAAPGVDILSTFKESGYTALSGTSMAAPYVSGALALLFAKEPALDPEEAIGRLYASAIPVPGDSTAQRVSAARLLMRDLPSVEVFGIDLISSRHGLTPKVVTAGSEVRIEVRGRGEGTVSLHAAFDGRPCEDVIDIGLENGSGSFIWKIPRNIRRSVRRFQVTAGETQATIRLRRRRGSRAIWSRRSLCSQLYLSRFGARPLAPECLSGAA